jgi:hypothetical protein
MRRNDATGPGLRVLAGLALLVLFAPAVPAHAQLPQPYFPTVEQRSGLLGRFVPIEPNLPPDKFRDTFYDTRWTDHFDVSPNHPNWFRSGGLYGRRWPGFCTQSFYPYFFGSPGQPTGGPDGCKPGPRWLKYPQTFVHPFRPVCYYYDEGSYVPIYDLDPVAPGPGRVPNWFPFYLKDPHGG